MAELGHHLCVPLQMPLIKSRPRLRKFTFQSGSVSLRRSRRLAAKPKAANPTVQAQKVLMVKLGLASATPSVDSASFEKFDSIFAEPLSATKHEAFKVLFQDNDFLNSFVLEVQEVELEERLGA